VVPRYHTQLVALKVIPSMRGSGQVTTVGGV
jgi:hypothetical protein